MELTGQPWECPVTFSLWTVTGRAWRKCWLGLFEQIFGIAKWNACRV
jgi:hypothetical protein